MAWSLLSWLCGQFSNRIPLIIQLAFTRGCVAFWCLELIFPLWHWLNLNRSLNGCWLLLSWNFPLSTISRDNVLMEWTEIWNVLITASFRVAVKWCCQIANGFNILCPQRIIANNFIRTVFFLFICFPLPPSSGRNHHYIASQWLMANLQGSIMAFWEESQLFNGLVTCSPSPPLGSCALRRMFRVRVCNVRLIVKCNRPPQWPCFNPGGCVVWIVSVHICLFRRYIVFFFFLRDALNVLPLFTPIVTVSYDYSRTTSTVTVKELPPPQKKSTHPSVLFGLSACHPIETFYDIPDLHWWIFLETVGKHEQQNNGI